MATPTLVGGTQVASTSIAASSGTLAMPGNVTSGNVVLIAVAWANTNSNAVVITKSSGTATIGTPTLLSTRANTQNASLGAGSSTANTQLWGVTITGSGSLTLQVAVTSAGFMGWCQTEWSSLTLTLDGTQPANVNSIVAPGNGTNHTITANGVTTSVANSLVCGWSTDDGGGTAFTLTNSGSWTVKGTGAVTGNPIAFVYQVIATPGANAPVYTLGGSSGGTGDACIGSLALLAAPSTTLYMLLGTAAPVGLTLPAGYLSSPNIYSNAVFAGSGAAALSAAAGSSQLSSIVTPNSVTTFSGLAQFCSAALQAQGTISAANCTIGIANAQSSASTAVYEAYVYLINGSTGAVRTTLSGGDPIGSNKTNTSETTNYSIAVALSAFTPTANDYLLVEIVAHYASNPGVGQTLTFYSDGTTAITANGSATSSAQSFIAFAQALLFAVSTPPRPTIVRQAVQRAAVW